MSSLVSLIIIVTIIIIIYSIISMTSIVTILIIIYVIISMTSIVTILISIYVIISITSIVAILILIANELKSEPLWLKAPELKEGSAQGRGLPQRFISPPQAFLVSERLRHGAGDAASLQGAPLRRASGGAY